MRTRAAIIILAIAGAGVSACTAAPSSAPLPVAPVAPVTSSTTTTFAAAPTQFAWVADCPAGLVCAL